jgi:hypothetical protein
MKNVVFLFLVMLTATVFAAQSVIVEAAGTASMGDTKSKKETMEEARANAMRNASENAGIYISSETKIKNYVLESDIVEAFARAEVRILSEKGEWFRDESLGDSYRVTIQAEVTPGEMKEKPGMSTVADDPGAPLKVTLWAEKNQVEFLAGETIRLYLKGNKPFFARIVYVQNDGTQVQLLPNPYRQDNYFNGGTVYTLPSGPDHYELTVTPPFGSEKIILYASTAELGDVAVEDAGAVYTIAEKIKDTGVKTRGIKITKKQGKDTSAAEFDEQALEIVTSK